MTVKHPKILVLFDITTSILNRIREVLLEVNPDVVLVHGDTTERPEGISAGTLKLIGTSEDTIYSEFKHLLTDKSAYDAMAKASNPYGDGYASKRIADVLAGQKKTEGS